MIYKRVIGFIGISSVLAGCGVFTGDKPVFRDRLEDYRYTEVYPATKIPDHLDATVMKGSALPLPRGYKEGEAVLTEDEIPPKPDPMLLVIEKEGLEVKETGGQIWLEAEMPASEILNALPRFLEEMSLEEVDRSGDNAIVVAGISDESIFGLEDDNIYFRVRKGIHTDKTEIYIRHLTDQNGEVADVDWSQPSHYENIDRVIYTELALYLSSLTPESHLLSEADGGELEARMSVSGNGVSVLVLDNVTYPVAWQLVGEALKKTGLKVEDYNRTEGVYYLRLPKNAEELDETKIYLVDIFDEEEEHTTEIFRLRVTAADGSVYVGLERDASTVADNVRTMIVLERLEAKLK